MSKVISRCRGWASGPCGASGGAGVNVSVWGVCACSWRKGCVVGKRCQKLFSDGGEHGADRTLSELMKESGRRMPKSWSHDRIWKRQEAWKAKMDLKDKFEKEYFERCRPMEVEVRRR